MVPRQDAPVLLSPFGLLLFLALRAAHRPGRRPTPPRGVPAPGDAAPAAA
ncbi:MULTISPECIES: hypothetical protein [Streptomyces]|uniref:Uncharacterized protein n=1 Tax=Streptomyces ramulosus TaxID=47762 RepID=A0ABW1FR68_9ACTN